MGKYLFLFIFLFFGCELFTDYRTITISFPKELPPWFKYGNEQTGEIFYPGISGFIESTPVKWNKDICIQIEKGSSIPIACYPMGNLKPAGAVLINDISPVRNLQLNWEEGFLAELLLDLMKKKIPIEHLNIKRLEEEIKIKSEGNPWSIDRELLMDAIIYNSLSVYKIKSGPLQDITLPVEGRWISDNPFYPLSVSNIQGVLILEKIYPGLHRFLNLETKEKLDILIREDGYEYLILQQY